MWCYVDYISWRSCSGEMGTDGGVCSGDSRWSAMPPMGMTVRACRATEKEYTYKLQDVRSVTTADEIEHTPEACTVDPKPSQFHHTTQVRFRLGRRWGAGSSCTRLGLVW